MFPFKEEKIEDILRYQNVLANRELKVALVEHCHAWMKCYKKFGKNSYDIMAAETFNLSRKFKV